MGGIKRVLWVEDNARQINSSIRNMFRDEETKIISSMDEAIREIAGEHLYDYDTIVLDIDFENGLLKPDEVIKKLSGKIYLKKDQQNKKFVEDNGGYLLFLYLLEMGYPSSQIAFLTGNTEIIKQLQIYNRLTREEMSRDEIADKFIELWQQTEGDYDEFEDLVDELPIEKEFRHPEFVVKCEEELEAGRFDALKELINRVEIKTVTNHQDEAADRMIFRFHEANLESPVYFSKRENDIAGHNRENAEHWLSTKRTSNKVFRWLVLSAGEYMEALWRADNAGMTQQVRNVLFVHNDNNSNYDFGIRNAFRQMFFVFDGLKAVTHAGAYYQAMAAMLIPFESSIRNHHTGDDELAMRRQVAFCSKHARNYSAHNYFGSAITDKHALFLLMIVMTAILNRNQRGNLSSWYEQAKREIVGASAIPSAANVSAIDDLVRRLWLTPCKIDTDKCNVGSNYAAYSPNDFLVVLGWNKEMRTDTANREAYFMFSLAAHLVKVFEGKSDQDIEHAYGPEVRCLHEVAKVMVDGYSYPNPLPV